jgi:hypothetical protein
MNLSLGVIMDELAPYKPAAHTMRSSDVEFRRFSHYGAEVSEPDSGCLYVLDGRESPSFLGRNLPRHSIVAGGAPGLVPGLLRGKTEGFDTLVHIPGAVSADMLLQAGYAIFESYETWRQNLLLAIIQRKPINGFLEIAAEKLNNPLALFDNNMAILSTAGTFEGSTEGTIWEKLHNPEFSMIDFYTPQELREASQFISMKEERFHIRLLHPSVDSNHAYLGSDIRINDKPYGYIGMVDINAPFTNGQISIVRWIIWALGLYFQNNNIYMRMLENNVNYLESLLEGADISEDIVSYYMGRLKWKLCGEFCLLSFTGPADFSISAMAVSYIKQISALFPLALVSVYRDSIIMIVRCADYKIRRSKERQQLEKFLIKTEMRCGVSMVFANFMRLRHYYVQSSFAAAWCETHPNSPLCYYENCQSDHVLQSLGAAADLRSFCHPGILALWESGDEGQQELVRCLYYYVVNGGNLAATAKALFIHRNTLIYRIEKLSNLLENDLKTLKPEPGFFYLLSCVIVMRGLP